MRTGRTAELTQDCSGLAATRDAVYFLAKGRRAYALKKIAGLELQTLADSVNYDVVRITAHPDRLALEHPNLGRSAIWDIPSARIVTASDCGMVTALADGTVVYGNGGELSFRQPDRRRAK